MSHSKIDECQEKAPIWIPFITITSIQYPIFLRSITEQLILLWVTFFFHPKHVTSLVNTSICRGSILLLTISADGKCMEARGRSVMVQCSHSATHTVRKLDYILMPSCFFLPEYSTALDVCLIFSPAFTPTFQLTLTLVNNFFLDSTNSALSSVLCGLRPLE